ncbi:hypothetical protein KUL42_06550 [Alteromonas sp. KUL42]|uniref:methyl-accepting chemotaxis protein n=1 Tax=Alteromonas sp. KUL42 TaxID=2480797 RepID=UPI0010358C16|nr:methyl-accepting chemotaxis protein [Alteromonas sp. KUL42]TAP37482.1 hypothetical protein EYR97_03250 [Alteromonas sp. KUL42]GEA05894.1 hypothetical protein KUL42_06550 [Alteromonas sp. KUL42]
MKNLLFLPGHLFFSAKHYRSASYQLTFVALVLIITAGGLIILNLFYLALIVALLSIWCFISHAVLVTDSIVSLDDTLKLISTERKDYRSLAINSDVLPEHVISIVNAIRELTRERDKLAEVLSEISYSCEQVIKSASDVSANVHSQSNATTTTAAAVSEMTQSLAEVAHKIKQANEASNKASELASQGHHDVVALSKEVETITIELSDTQTAMSSLRQQTAEVLSLTSSIQSIAEQTNLLALNASIEAARAGEMGRGFAVVAEEVRHLAEESNQCAERINKSIKALTLENDTVSQNLDLVQQQAVTCLEKATDASDKLSAIHAESDDVQKQVLTVSANTSQQSIATEEIAKSIERVVETAAENARIAEQTTKVAEYLMSITGTNKEIA